MSAIEAVTNSSLGIASTIMTTAATIITGERANAILSGGATVFNSSRDHLNAHVYRAQLTQAITSAITQERDAIRESIERRFDSKTTEWSIDDGVREVNRYHQTCSFYRGLELVLRATNERSELERRARISALEATLERMAANDPNRQAVQAELILLTTGVTVPNR